MSAADPGPRRSLPSVRAVLDGAGLALAIDRHGRGRVTEAVRRALAEARAALVAGEEVATAAETLAARALALLEADGPSLRPVLNATGILLNTGLGRAPLAAEAIEAIARVARGYCNLEVDLDRGDRGRRGEGVEALLTRLVGSEAALVVNNNAAATILGVRALAAGREVVVSRGQLVEIGGSYRLPEIIEASGAKLREVGTTNKTRLSDYERAIGPETAALLRVHPSNYRIVGFAEEVPIAPLAQLARAHGLWTIDDIGSGALGPGLPPLVQDEPTARQGIEAGADLVLFSGDKLLGGPQAGIMVGTVRAIDRARRDPLARALRVDKLTLAALEATLRLALDPARAADRIPLWAALQTPLAALQARAQALAHRFRLELGLDARAIESTSYLGGGTTPAHPLPTAAIQVGPPFPPATPTESGWSQALRNANPPVLTRIQSGAVLFDLRAIPPADDETLFQAARATVSHD